MNKLKEYRGKLSKAYEKQEEFKFADDYEAGFDAAIALDLPLKFHRWIKDWPFGIKRRKEYEAILKVYPHPTDEELYKYWIDNIYKPDL